MLGGLGQVGAIGRSQRGIVTDVLAAPASTTFSRSSPATATDLSGVVTTVGNDVARTAGGYLIEGAGSNLISNPRAVGGEVSGTAPTGWGLAASDTSLVVTAAAVWLGQANINGINCQLVRISTAGANLASTLVTRVQVMAAIATTAAQGITLSSYVAVYAGTLANITVISLRMPNATVPQQTIAPTGTLTRFGKFFAYGADNASQPIQITLAGTTGTPVDVTLAIGFNVAEPGNVLTSPILPAVSTIATSTRSADSLALTGTNFTSVFGTATAGCLIMDVNLSTLTGPALAICELGDGTYANRVFVYAPATNQLQIVRWDASTSTFGSLATGTLTAGTTARVGLRWGPGLGFDLSLNGNAFTTVSGNVPAGLVRLQIGNIFDLSLPANGKITTAYAGKFRPTDASFLAASTLGTNPKAILR